MEEKIKIKGLNKLSEKLKIEGINLCVLIFWAIVFLSQILIVSRVKLFYFLGLALFYFLLIYLIYFFGRDFKLKRNFFFPLLIFLVFILRLPFFFYPQGLLFTSDNALDALQTQEIASTYHAPYYLLGVLRHMGTTKYILASFLWKVFGSHYLLYTLTQVLMYSVLLICLYFIFKSTATRALFFVLLLNGFSFIETMFDNSLSLRAGSEFEMACFFLIGAALFDPTFTSRWRFFLSFYFIFFSFYLHTLGAAFALAFILTIGVVGLFSYPTEKLIRLIWPSLSGIFLGLFHWLYYLLFVPKPPIIGGWEKINWRWPGDFSLNLIRTAAQNVKNCFLNLFSFEFKYLINFFQEQEKKTWLVSFNQATIVISMVIFLLALIIACYQFLQFIVRKERNTSLWPSIFFLFLLSAFLAKNLLLDPPLLEPRHNFDLLILVMLAYFITGNSLHKIGINMALKIKKKDPAFSSHPVSILIKKTALPLFITFLILIQFLFTLPHYFYYFKMTQHKEALYSELLATLKKYKIHYLATDFIIAYPIYFLSGRKILVSDSLGPLTIRQFFPQIRERVDKIPMEKKAYLFFSEDYPASSYHKKATAVIKNRLLNNLQKKGQPYRTVRIKYFILIIPGRL